MTGFSPAVRAIILQRDGGCIICGAQNGLQIHHRSPRQMGGAKADWVNKPSNGVSLCLRDHAWTESHRADAENLGIIVRRGQHGPAEIPVKHALFGVVFLLDDGKWTTEEP